MELALKHVPSNVTFTSPDIIELQTKNDQLAEENKALKGAIESWKKDEMLNIEIVSELKATQAVLVEALSLAKFTFNYCLGPTRDVKTGHLQEGFDTCEKALSEVTDTIPKRDNV